MRGPESKPLDPLNERREKLIAQELALQKTKSIEERRKEDKALLSQYNRDRSELTMVERLQLGLEDDFELNESSEASQESDSCEDSRLSQSSDLQA